MLSCVIMRGSVNILSCLTMCESHLRGEFFLSCVGPFRPAYLNCSFMDPRTDVCGSLCLLTYLLVHGLLLSVFCCKLAAKRFTLFRFLTWDGDASAI